MGLKKVKVGKNRLKGWWDEEVAKAIGDRKRANRRHKDIKDIKYEDNKKATRAYRGYPMDQSNDFVYK